MNKRQLVEEIAGVLQREPEEVGDVVQSFIDVVRSRVAAGDKVVLQGFGTFTRQTRARRTGRDIGAGEPVAIPPTTVPVFRPGKPFRELVAQRARRRTPRPAPRRTRTRGRAP